MASIYVKSQQEKLLFTYTNEFENLNLWHKLCLMVLKYIGKRDSGHFADFNPLIFLAEAWAA